MSALPCTNLKRLVRPALVFVGAVVLSITLSDATLAQNNLSKRGTELRAQAVEMSRARAQLTLRERVIGALTATNLARDLTLAERIEILEEATGQERIASTGPISQCKAACYHDHSETKNRAELNQCLTDCDAVAAVQALHDRLVEEVTLTFVDIVWGGGDIDPKPLEKAVRERFSRPPGRMPQ